MSEQVRRGYFDSDETDFNEKNLNRLRKAQKDFFYDFTMAQWNIGVFSTFGAVFFGCAVYLLMLILIGGVREEDVQRIPMIGRIFIRAMRRIGVFKSKDEQGVH